MNLNENKKYGNWKHSMSFYVFKDKIPGSKRVAVGDVYAPFKGNQLYRQMLNHSWKN